MKKPDGTTPTDSEIEDLDEKIDEYHQKDSLVKQQIFSTISDQLLLRVQNLGSASKIWDEVCKIHEGKTELVQIDLRRRLQELRCDEGGDIKAHFAEQLRLRESLAGMGASIDDRDFYAIILGSLPESYRPLLSSINAAAKIASKPLSPYELINVVTEEYEHRQLTERRTGKKGHPWQHFSRFPWSVRPSFYVMGKYSKRPPSHGGIPLKSQLGCHVRLP